MPETVEQEDDENIPMKEDEAVQTDLLGDQIDGMVITLNKQKQAFGRFSSNILKFNQ